MINTRIVNSRRILLPVFLIAVIFSTISCNKVQVYPHTLIYPKKNYVNKRHNGKIAIKLDFDTIQLKDKDVRGTYFFYGLFEKKHSVKELEKMKDSLEISGYPEGNRDTIYFHYTFDKTGDYYIDGFVEDVVLIKNNDGKKARLLKNQIKISSDKIEVR